MLVSQLSIASSTSSTGSITFDTAIMIESDFKVDYT